MPPVPGPGHQTVLPTPELPKYRDLVVHYSHIAIEARCENPDLVVSYQDNLCRLGLTRYQDSAYLATPNAYTALEQDPFVLHYIESVKKDDEYSEVAVKRGYIEITRFGKMFCAACVIDKDTPKDFLVLEEMP